VNGYIRPEVDPDNERFWSAVDRSVLLVWSCADCGGRFLPPLPGCPDCGSVRVAATTATGRGTIESWIVVHRPLAPEFAGDVPYVVGAVRLDEGARIFGRVEEVDSATMREGLPVRFAPSARGDHRMIAFVPA
jgi:uncharacterized OB-fold protein